MNISELPLELLKQIAGELSVIRDVLSFSLVSHFFYDAVNSDQYVYQALFLHTYEPPAVPQGYDWKTQFRRRRSALINLNDKEVIREMIFEARPTRKSPASVATSANIIALFKAESYIMRELDGLLYPMKLIQYATRPEDHRSWRNSHFLNIIRSENILKRYPQDSASISNFFCQVISGGLQKNGLWVFGLSERVKLEPCVLPNFWEGEAKNDEPIPSRWYGGYIQWGIPFRLADMKLKFSEKGIFSSEGHDIEPYTIHQGVVREAGADGRRRVSWVKAYNGFQWAYEGVLDYGGQRMTGVWADRQNGHLVPGWGGSFGIFMYWAVPEAAPSLV